MRIDKMKFVGRIYSIIYVIESVLEQTSEKGEAHL